MTGQVDEAGRGVEAVIAMLRATGNPKAAAEVAGLRTQLAERGARIETLVRISNVNGDWNIKHANLQADRDRLAGQVAAIRALCDEAVETAAQEGIPDFAAVVEVFEVRAALAASSPTTPQPPEVSE